MAANPLPDDERYTVVEVNAIGTVEIVLDDLTTLADAVEWQRKLTPLCPVSSMLVVAELVPVDEIAHCQGEG